MPDRILTDAELAEFALRNDARTQEEWTAGRRWSLGDICNLIETAMAMRSALEAWVRAMTIPYDHENPEDGRLDIAIELTKAAGIEWPEDSA